MSSKPTSPPQSNSSVVVMGVSGCGKSTLAAALARALGWRFIEGDDFHGAANRASMQAGKALDDEDRAEWLATLARELKQHQQKALLTCSALKLQYRETLRAACPGLRFIFLDITPELARQRAQARSGHFFDPALVDSQFEALESPALEPAVLRLDAARSIADLCASASRWIAKSRASHDAC